MNAIDGVVGRAVIGAEGTMGNHLGAQAEARGNGSVDIAPTVSTGTPGISVNAGMVISEPRPDDFKLGLTLASGPGASLGIAINKDGLRLTDARFVLGTPQARVEFSGTFEIPIPAPTPSRVGPMAPTDATRVHRP